MALIKTLKKFTGTISKRKVYIPLLSGLGLLIVLFVVYLIYPRADRALVNNFTSGNYDQVIADGNASISKTHNGDLETAQVVAGAYMRKASMSIDERTDLLKHAIAVLNGISAKYPDNSETLRLLGYAYYMNGSTTLAKSYLREALKVSSSTNSFAWSTLGHIDEATSMNTARQDYQQALKYNASNEDALVGMANYYVYEHQSRLALDAGRKLTLSKDVQVQALGHQIKGLVFSNTSTTTKDELAAAKKEFETALALNPNLVPSLIGEANILLNELITKRVSNIKTATQPAMDMAQRILLLDKNNPYAFAIFAKAYALRGQKDTYDKYAALALDAARKSTTLPAQAKKDFERIFATGKNKPIVKINSIKIISSGTGTTTKVAPK